ncbi:GMC family oxidoreductase [Aliikangiella maris]|uniref:GMC family oxidoreductase N-terminal domain-containing protein n=2 Tax=Aliikangiella maris TaxID=3162458 RepID=A0ABV2BWU6_9GAMM
MDISVNQNSVTEYDYIIIGGGSAGCVAAARLSANPAKKVLLIEAGGASDVNHQSSPLRDASRLVLEGYNWDYTANIRDKHLNIESFTEFKNQLTQNSSSKKIFNYRLGKVMGGSSAVNGAVALRAFPSDFALWEQQIGKQWSWESVLPWYKQLEHDLDFAEHQLHGSQGPMRLRRPQPEEIHPLDATFADISVKQGLNYVDDLNIGEAPGVGLVPSNVAPNAERIDVYRAYLEPLKSRENLSVITDALVDKVKLENQQVIGITIKVDDKEYYLQSSEVVLSAGAIGSAAVLQRSGIGDPDHLGALNIPLNQALPGVGKNLQDHSSLVVWSVPKPGVCQSGMPWRQFATRSQSGVDQQTDIQIGLLNSIDSTTVPGFQDIAHPALVGISVMLMRPQARGKISIQSTNPQQRPLIYLPIAQDQQDILRMVAGVRNIWQTLQAPTIRQYLQETLFWSETIINNDKVMQTVVSNLINPGWHASGTLKMGRKEDPDAVTDENGCVHGINGLTVLDASVFPAIPSMPTNLTTIMVAEKLSDQLIQRSQS